MQNKKYAVLTILIMLISSASVYGETINLITDQYWHEIIMRENSENPILSLRQSIIDVLPFLDSQDIFAGKKKIKTTVINLKGGTADYNLASDAVSSIKGHLVILSPLLSYDACTLAGNHPEKKFIAIGTLPERDCGTDNCVFLEINRGSAFFNAGLWAAGQGKDVYTLFFTETSQTAAEKEAFLEGWAKADGGNEPAVLKIKNISDTATVDIFVDKIENSPECIAAVFAGPLGVTALDRLDGLSCEILSEHLGIWPHSLYSEAATIELEPAKMLLHAVTYYNTETYGDKVVVEAEFILHEN